MKKRYVLISICTFLTTYTAENKLNIQKKSREVISLEEHSKEIYLLKNKHAQDVQRYQAQIAYLREALDKERSTPLARLESTPLMEVFRGAFY